MDEKKINIVLAGQGNTGKSTIFNHLTGLHQHIGNWAGKTIEKYEGTLFYKGYTIDIIDLPGIYSFTTYSEEEIISREYIVHQRPDCVINILDSTNLERNLIFTLQLLELERPVIVALNMSDIAKKRGITIDYEKLRNILGVPVIPVIATFGTGMSKIVDEAIEQRTKNINIKTHPFGKEIEDCIDQLSKLLKDIDLKYPARWIAIKLLEKDKDIIKSVHEKSAKISEKAKALCEYLESIHGHDSSLVIADERSHLAYQITRESVTMKKHQKASFNERLDSLTTHGFTGYLLMIIILGGMFLTVFLLGNWLSGLLEGIFNNWHVWWDKYAGTTVLASVGWAAVESALALAQIAFPYILPFYIILYFLEDWGYIARISFLTDQLMHKMGIHGKACISFIIGLGCNVPGCLSCRIMESRRERFITAVLVTLVPCSAVSVIIFGLVGKYVGLLWAFGLYLFAMITIFFAGKISSKLLLGEPVELIMPMSDYKTPQLKTILYQTWAEIKEFIVIAAPIVIVSGVIIHIIHIAGWMQYISAFLSPITVKWLGLPAMTGIMLIFGILRKELILVMLAAYLGTNNFSEVLSHNQMITLAVVSMFYVPCVATISVLWKEYGWKKALAVCIMEIIIAILLGGLVMRILPEI